MLSACWNRLSTAGGAIAVAACLILWLTLWPIWLVRSHYLLVPAKSSATRG